MNMNVPGLICLKQPHASPPLFCSLSIRRGIIVQINSIDDTLISSGLYVCLYQKFGEVSFFFLLPKHPKEMKRWQQAIRRDDRNTFCKQHFWKSGKIWKADVKGPDGSVVCSICLPDRSTIYWIYLNYDTPPDAKMTTTAYTYTGDA
ncbi:uncharacterized protein LOC117167888 [Belonocnema kinseyi]|uniref:uncharacterized protein LOC117167888 n=1 Tax=Belonocnema kinseyi TaxID=2817044 RepID=UPI00143DCB8F|nr:uncharacterized protein LOC117167888 [Belonocnema kinseyi]